MRKWRDLQLHTEYNHAMLQYTTVDGDQGVKGDQGIKEEKEYQGERGDQGYKGVKGDQVANGH